MFQQEPPPYPTNSSAPPQGYPTASGYQPPEVQYIHQRQGDEVIIQPAQVSHVLKVVVSVPVTTGVQLLNFEHF